MNMTPMRLTAVAVALLAVADPALTSPRSSRPLVGVISGDPANRELVERVAGVLDRDFTVVRGAPGAGATTVLVGDELPDETASLAAPLVAVIPARRDPSLRITAVETPAVALLDSRVPVELKVAVTGAKGRRVDVRLQSGGSLVDQGNDVVTSDSALLEVRLSLIASRTGATLLQASATMEGTAVTDSVTTVVEIRAERSSILFFDPVPSWHSTFVRRAVAGDVRFAVAHRVSTSRGVANTGGPAPRSLQDAGALAAYATIVVGSPDQLGAADVTGLDAFMREHGGRVVLLMDRPRAGPVDRLTGVGAWRATRLAAPAPLADTSGVGALRVQEIAWPAVIPAGATAHAVSVGTDSTRRAVMWSVPVGAGRLFVSGALDAWQYRDRSQSAFESYWPDLLAGLSVSAPRSLDVELPDPLLTPGELGRVRVRVREAMLSGRDERAASVSSRLVSGSESTTLRLWPGAAPGLLEALFAAPARPGEYRIVVSSGRDSASAAFLVDSSARGPSRATSGVIEAFVSSRGGAVLQEADLRELDDRVSAALQTVSRVETWYPMRSAWWIVPFTLLLGAEWWSRRRRGLP